MLVKSIKKNEILFIEEEYVIFYELDPTNIFNDKRNVSHKSKNWSKFFESYINLLYIYIYDYIFIHDLNQNDHNKCSFLHVFYYINKFNKKYLIKKNFFKKFFYHNVLTFHFTKKKVYATLTYQDKLISYVTPGIFTKKLGIETKKTKKSGKIVNVLCKTIVKTCINNENSHKLVVQIKGTKISFYKIIDFIKLTIKKYTDAYFIYTPVISSNNKRFKKIRSLKKNFRKKFLKIN